MLIARTAAPPRDDARPRPQPADAIHPTEAAAGAGAPRPLAARAIRRWLDRDGYPPDAAGIARVLAVAAGESTACEITGRGRIERRDGRLVLFPTGPASG